jgi:hypothetical protein
VKAIIVAMIAKLGADEAKAWLPTMTEWLLEIAASRLPVSEQERYREEWRADLLAFPGEFSKGIRALGFVCAAFRMRGMGLASRASAFLSRPRDLRIIGPLVGSFAVAIACSTVTVRHLSQSNSYTPYWKAVFIVSILLAAANLVLAVWWSLLTLKRYRRSSSISRMNVNASSLIKPGQIIGRRIGSDPEDECDHFFNCATCGQAVDMRDLGQVVHHEILGHNPLA